MTLPDGRRVGELDEEMVYEARPGQTFLLGASTWRIEEIGRDRVIVTPAPGLPGAVPFWKGDGIGRPKELGAAIGEFARWAVDQEPETLEHEYDLDRRAAGNLVEFLQEQQAATRVVPSDRAIVIERFRDEIGDWRLCVLSPFGGRVHSAWALALSARIREQVGLESDAIWSDDGIIVHLPDAEEPPGAELVLIDPDEVEDQIVAELSASALFGARFRENAGRALLIPRARPGKRTPLWQQRLKSQSLLEVAKKYGEFPIVLETYRECLRDVLDVPGLVELLTMLHRREISLIEVETPTASPFASSLLFDYVATYMYEGDTPNAERRAAALSLDRDLLRELLGQEELRDLIDPAALIQVEDDLQFLSEIRQAGTRDALHDVLRTVGDLTATEAGMRVLADVDAMAMLEELRAERRAIAIRVGGEERWIDAADAGLYRDALGVAPPGGLPAAFLDDVPDALGRLVRRYGATHGPFTLDELRARYGVDPSAVLSQLERDGALVRGELRPGGSEREWCDSEVLRRLRRASLAVLRKEVEPVDQRALARFLPGWQNVDRHSASGAGIDRLREALIPLQGLALPADAWERDVLARRIGAYSPAWMDQLCASGEVVWIGAGSLGRNSGRVALYFREDLVDLGPPQLRGANPGKTDLDQHDAVRARLAAGACFFTDLLADVELAPEELQEALWDLAWAGEATNDAFAPLRAPRLTLARAQRDRVRATARRAGRFGSRRRGGAAAQVQGRWSLTEPLFREQVDPVLPPPRAGRAAARALRGADPRAGAGRGDRRRVLGDLRGAVPARDARRRPARVLRRGSRRRSVRAAWCGGAAPRAASLRGAADRACGRRSGATLRGSAAVADAPRRRELPASIEGRRRAGGADRRRADRVSRARRSRAADAGGGRRPAPPGGAGGAGRARAQRRDQAAGARARRRGAGDELATGPGAGRARLPGGPPAADIDRLSRTARRCPKATRSRTRPAGSGPCWRAAYPSRSPRRSLGTVATAGQSASAAAG